MRQSNRRDFLRAGIGAAALAGCGGETGQVEQRPPNLLLLFPDQHRYDWVGATPEIPVRTPNLDRIAARGTTFTNAVCASPLCAPSRACLASGKEYDNAGVDDNGTNYPLDQTTYYSLLRDAGYHVMGCGKF
ncbi:MAG: sulfatase-like hydrolase/transferase, partial [bacterium]|nr:sulfatase-like hydrolase/transferase [bacterium]